MEDRETAKRVELVWPAGYHARDDFGPELLDDSNTFVGKEGDLIAGACSTGGVGEPFHVAADDLQAAQ